MTAEINFRKRELPTGGAIGHVLRKSGTGNGVCVWSPETAPATVTAVPHSFAGSGVSDASGNVTIPFGVAFPAVPNVAVGLQTANGDATEARITALTVSSVTINCQRAPAVTVLAISVLGARQPLAGATVHVVAQVPGRVIP